MCAYRERGLFKRIRATPLPLTTYLTAIVANAIVIAIILTTLSILLGVTAYGITFPGRYLGLVVTVALGAVCFGAIGVAVSTFVPNEDAAPAMINFILFPLLFISGTFGSGTGGNSTLDRIAGVFPIQHLNRQMVAVFSPLAHGTGVIATHTAVLAAWSAGALFVAVRRFRWEPRYH